MHTPVIPPTQEADIGRIMVLGQSWKNVREITSQPTNWVSWCASVIPDTG
jgi:hypothetical protein